MMDNTDFFALLFVTFIFLVLLFVGAFLSDIRYSLLLEEKNSFVCDCDNSPVVESDDLYVKLEEVNNPNATMYTRNSEGDFEVLEYGS